MNDKLERIVNQIDGRWEPHHVEHLLLVVGGNPLPNAVAAVLLTLQGGTITLIHSEGEPSDAAVGRQEIGSFPVAQKLEAWLNDLSFAKVRLVGVRESRPDSIIQGVREALHSVAVTKIGINYTGGTKAMSVHAYRTVEEWRAEQREHGNEIEASFSYLDARRLEMVFDRASSQRSEVLYAGSAVKLDLEQDLLQIHGWKLKHPPKEAPVLPQSAQALLDVHTKPDAAERWREWLQNELLKKAKRPEQIVVNCSRSPDRQSCTVDQPGEKWANKTTLRAITLPWPTAPELRPLVEIMKSELRRTDGLDLGEAATKCSYKHPEDFCKWLNGGWLESVVLSALHQSLKDGLVDYVGMNLEPDASGDNPTGFEFDVVSLRGYQLFAFSCTTTRDKGSERSLLRLKLFEACIRARQLGGDAACVGLVCCSTDPVGMEYALRRDLDPEWRIRVFGIPHFADLASESAQWIREQSGEI
jgi:hypothetical protein